MRSDYCDSNYMLVILGALSKPNRLAVLVSMYTGLRISDVLALRTDEVRKQRFVVTESKTGKRRKIRLSDTLVDDLLCIAGKIYVFEGRCDYRKHRTRQAVYKDIKRACNLLRVSRTLQISPHTARKIYAVNVYKDTLRVDRVKSLLNHSSEAVTMVYAMADQLTARGHTAKQLDTLSV